MKKIKFLIIIAIFALLQFSCTDSTSGGETLNEKVALYMPDGITPAVDASVKFFSIGDTSATPIYQTQTDAEGRYTVSGVTSTGYYNVIAEYDDSLYTMQDTVYISQESNQVKDDTLDNPGSITGIVALQPNHSHLLNNVYVMALGMGRAVNVDSTGWFTMTKLAPGDYNLQFDTDIENYGPRFIDVTISSNVNDTLSDTTTLPYSGIPVVAGIRSSYDTLNGVATLNWNKSSYGNVYSYLIFRKSSDSLFFPEDPIGWGSSSDTCFNDTIFNSSIIDSSTKSYDYTIAILDSSTAKGPINSYIKVFAVSPFIVTTSFSLNLWNKVESKLVDTVSTSDSFAILLTLQNPTRPYKYVKWSITHPDSILSIKNAIDTSNMFYDTLAYIFKTEGNHKVYLIAEDFASTIWYDTITVPVWNFPDPSILKLDSIFAFSAQISWSKSTSNKFKSYKVFYTMAESPFNFSIPNSTIYDINDTSINIKALDDGFNYKFIIVTEDSSGVSSNSDTLSGSTLAALSKLSDKSISSYKATKTSHYNNFIYTFIDSIDTAEVYSILEDSWSIGPILPTTLEGYSATILNDDLYIIGGTNESGDSSMTSVHKYSFLTQEWTESSPCLTARKNHNSCILNNKIYIIRGFDQNNNIINTMESFDPSTGEWALELNIPAEFSGTSGWLPVIVDGKIYLITYLFDSKINVLSYDSDSKTIDLINSSNFPNSSMGALVQFAFELDGKIMIGGQDSGKGFLYSFDTNSNTFSTSNYLDNVFDNLYTFSITTIDEKAYMINGTEISLIIMK